MAGGKRILGVPLTEELDRDIRRSHPSAESGTPPPIQRNRIPEVVQSIPDSPIIIHGPGWKATIPAAILLAILTAIGTKLVPTPSANDSKLDRIESRQERFEDDARRTRIEQDRVNAVILQRLDRIESQQGITDSRIDDLRRRKETP